MESSAIEAMQQYAHIQLLLNNHMDLFSPYKLGHKCSWSAEVDDEYENCFIEVLNETTDECQSYTLQEAAEIIYAAFPDEFCSLK